MNKVSTFLVATLMLSNLSFAKDFTLDEAIDLAKQNNSTLITLNAEKRQQESDYKKAQKNDAIWKSKASYRIDTADEYLLHHGNALNTAKLKYDLYLTSIENAEDSIEYTLISTLYNLELAEDNIELLEDTIEIMEKQKLVYELKYQLNWITRLELDNFLLSLTENKNKLENLKANYDLGKENVRIMLGENEEVNVILPEVDNTELVIEDINQYSKDNLGNNKNLIELQYNYQLVENYYLTLKEGFYEDVIANDIFETKIQKDKYEATKQQVDMAFNNVSMLYVSNYNDIKMSDLTLEEKKNKLDLAKANMEVVQTRYDAGYVAELDYKSAKLNLRQTEIAYKTENVNNMLLKMKLEKLANSGFTTSK